MSRIVEGIKGLWKGKDDDDDDELPEYRYRYDQRQSPGSNRTYGYPATDTLEARSGNRRPFGEALDDNYVRNGYVDSRASPRGAEYRKPYGVSESSPRGTEYRRPYVGTEVASPRGDYVRASVESPREYQKSRRDSNDTVVEFMVPMCCDKCKEKVKEELSEVEGVESVHCDPRNSRVIVKGDDSIEVERCLKKAERAVKMKCELISNDAGAGTRDSGRYYSQDSTRYSAQDRARYGSQESGRYGSQDSGRYGSQDSGRYGSQDSGRYGSQDSGRYGSQDSGRYGSQDNRYGSQDSGRDGTRYGALDGTRGGSRVALASPSGKPSLARMPSFASGKVTQYDSVGPRGQDYDAKDYSGSGFRRMPSFSKYRNNEAEYVTSYDQRPEPLDSRREAYAVRRMPSFDRYRNHDAEYITAGEREESPRTFYESNAGGAYSTAYNERPVYRSQVSFSKLPVDNPNYVKHIAY